LPCRNPGQHHGRFHVFQRRQPLQQVEELEDEADRAPPQFCQGAVVQAADLHSVQVDSAVRGAVQAADQVHQRAFAVSGRADDTGEAAPLYLQADTAQGGGGNGTAVVDLGGVFEFDDGVIIHS